MAHNLHFDGNNVAMMFVGDVPWHGLGTRFEHAPATAAEAIKGANLDWEVGLKPVYCADGQHYYELPERKAIVRLDKWGQQDCQPFGLVGNDYQVYQNRDAFAFFDPLLATKKVAFESAGALGGGERVWVTAKVDGDIAIGNDRLLRYLLLSTGHDGKTAVQIRFTPVRVVCQNTLMAATMSGRDFAKVYHVPGMQHPLFDAQTQLESILNSFAELESSFAKMIQTALEPQKLAGYLTAVFPDPVRRNGQSESSYVKALARVQGTRKDATKYFREGRGNGEPPAEGTLWAAYNGVVELLDHHGTYRDRWDRLESLWFGDAQRVKQRAYDEACKMLAA